MGVTGKLKFNKKELEKLQKQLEELEKGKARDKFFEDCAKDLAARLLSLVKPKTPVGVYDDPSRKGGTLRRGWTGGKRRSAEAFADSLTVKKSGKTYTITVENNVEYAPYVEYGHRTRGGKGFVQGKHMLETSEQELKALSPNVLKRKLNAFLREVLNDG